MKKPIIGLVCRKNVIADQAEIVCVEGTRKALVQAGAICFLIISTQGIDYKTLDPKEVAPYTEGEKKDLYRILEMCDAIVMPGGTMWYEMDELIARYCIDYDKPLLGICLGMQLLAKMCLPTSDTITDPTIANDTDINHFQPDIDAVHTVNIKNDSKLFEIIKEPSIMVNSRHHYHVPEIPEKYVSARSDDGIIEGIEIPDKKFIVGVQWHPELLYDKDIHAQKIIDALLNSI